MSKRRVVVTGIGAVTPLGNTVEQMWSAMQAGEHGIGEITAFDAANYEVKLAAEVKSFDPLEHFSKMEAKRLDRYAQFALVSARQAYADAGLEGKIKDPYRFGVIYTTGIGGLKTIEQETEKLLTKGPRRVSPMFIPMAIVNMAAGNIAIDLGAKGHCTAVVTACASATHALGDALRMIQYGDADVILTGGAEATITPSGIAGFQALRALSTSTNPDRASIPFDKERNGFIMGEGGGALVLEEYEHAKKRGAKIYAELAGFGSTCDANHITAPDATGEAGARALTNAIADAQVTLADIDYINAHGTSTPLNDKTETTAIKVAFGDLAKQVAVGSTKSMTGHLLGAAGAIEAIICVKAIEEGYLPQTINLQVADEACDLDYIAEGGRKQAITVALSNSLGFGGHNATVAFKKVEE
ncbi:MAG: beta-ketoacyl-ACP synthase II [Culicoidibacterales bacterium]